jgi:predicted dehydrogenase
MDKLGVGIVGAGLIGQVHAEALAGIEQAELKAVYNRSPKRGNPLADRFHVTWYDDYDRFLARDDINVAIICTPSGLHADFALPAAAAGKHLIVEKPLEITAGRCDRIIEAAMENGVTLSVIYQNRFKDNVQALKKALDEGRFGRLVLSDAHIKWYRPEEYFQGWKGTKKYDGGGALMNQGCHTIDLLQWMMGKVETVFGYVDILAHKIEVEDVGVAALRFKSGVLGIIEGSTAIYPGLDEQLGVYGEDGCIEIEGNRVRTWQFKEERAEDAAWRSIGKDKESGESSGLAGIEVENHRRELREITTAIFEGKKPPIDGDEAKKSVAIIEAIYESNRTGKPVILN